MAHANSTSIAQHGRSDAGKQRSSRRPTHFGKYLLLDLIRVGSTAEIFKAKAVGIEGFERILALKRLLPEISEDRSLVAKLVEEAKIAAHLQHENIVQVLDVGRSENSYFIALEFVDGRDLGNVCDALRDRGQRMPTPQACHIIIQLCEALDFAHSRCDVQGRALHLVHGDVSPQHVLISYEGEVKLTDFGSAEAASRATRTHPGMRRGLLGYLSPEQVRGLPVDQRSDIFALGIVFHELLTGERLFEGESDLVTLEKVRTCAIPAPSSRTSDIPAELEAIVLKALARNVADRYQSAVELRRDIEGFLDSAGESPDRRGLAAWMRRTFPMDSVQPAPPAREEITARTSPSVRPAGSAEAPTEDLDWDEEEKLTEVFEREPRSSRASTLAVDRATPEPMHPEMGHSQETPPPSAAVGFPAPMQPPSSPPRLSPTPPSALASPAQAFPTTPFPGTPILSRPPQLPLPAPAYVRPPAPMRGPRVGYYLAAALLALLGGVGFYWFWPLPGVLQLSVKPPDARLAVDGMAVSAGPPYRLAKRAGVHHLRVSRPGYVPFEREVQITARQTGHLDVVLKPSPDTGFALTSTPTGGLVWLDGQPLVLDQQGGQARTDLQAKAIAPGPHVIEVKGSPHFQPWQQHFVQAPDRTVLLHADLVPIGAAAAPAGAVSQPAESQSVARMAQPAVGAQADKTYGPSRSRKHRSPQPTTNPSVSRDPFESDSRSLPPGKAESASVATEDIFEDYGQSAGGAGSCVATIGSKPWAELLIDGKPTGRLTPVVNYSLPCGSHRLTFRNEDLMIERNERVVLRPGRPFKKIFQLVADEL